MRTIVVFGVCLALTRLVLAQGVPSAEHPRDPNPPFEDLTNLRQLQAAQAQLDASGDRESADSLRKYVADTKKLARLRVHSRFVEIPRAVLDETDSSNYGGTKGVSVARLLNTLAQTNNSQHNRTCIASAEAKFSKLVRAVSKCDSARTLSDKTLLVDFDADIIADADGHSRVRHQQEISGTTIEIHSGVEFVACREKGDRIRFVGRLRVLDSDWANMVNGIPAIRTRGEIEFEMKIASGATIAMVSTGKKLGRKPADDEEVVLFCLLTPEIVAGDC